MSMDEIVRFFKETRAAAGPSCKGVIFYINDVEPNGRVIVEGRDYKYDKSGATAEEAVRKFQEAANF